MKIKDLFIIILKVLGIYFLKNILDSVLGLVSAIASFGDSISMLNYFEGLFFCLLICAVYFLVAWLLLFKTNYIIVKLGLDKGFSQDEININIHRSVILSIALIVLGGIIILNEIPVLIRLLFTKFEARHFEPNPINNANVVFSICKLIIGFVLIYYRQTIVNLIEFRRKK